MAAGGRKFNDGDRVRFSINAPLSLRNQYPNTIWTINNLDYYGYRIKAESGGYQRSGVRANQLELVGPINTVTPIDSMIAKATKLTEQIDKLQTERDETLERVLWMQSNGLTEFNDLEFKVWRVLKQLNSNEPVSDLERARLIAQIIQDK